MNRESFPRGFVLAPLLLPAVAILMLALAGGVDLAVEGTPTPVPGAEQQLTWKSLNGPQERAAFGLAVVTRKKKSRLFAATWGQGTYCTTVRRDDGSYDDWKPCSNGLSKYIRPLAALPSSETTVYAGSGGQGLFRTRDSGFSWEQLTGRGAASERKSMRDPLYVESILVVPNARKALFRPGDLKDPAGLASKLQRGGGDVAQYLREHLSPDMKKLLDEYEPAGEPPEELKQALAAELNRLLQNDCLGDIVGLYPTFFADNYYKEIANTERIFMGNHNGVWVSDNWGERWDQVTVGFCDTDEAYSVQALAYSPAGWLYAGTLGGLYASANGGQVWELVPPPDSYPDEASRILSLAVLTDSNSYTGTLLVGTDRAGLYAVDIESQSWSTAAAGFLDDDERAQTIQALLAVPGGAAYAGTVDFGVYVSDDGGKTWQPKAEGLPPDSLSILALVRDWADGTVYAGTYGDGVYRLRPDSSRWEPVNEGFPPAFPLQAMVFVGPSHEGLLAGVQVGGIYVNTNRQDPEPSWTRLPKALPIGQERNVVALAASGPDGNRVLIATAVGLFLSTDGGRTSNPLGADQGLPAEGIPVRALAQGKEDPTILYAALGDSGEIYRSENGGQTWEAVPSDLDQGIRQGMCCLETGGDDNTVYLGVGASSVYTQVYVTTDGGRHWDPLAPIDEAGSGDLEELAWSDRSELDKIIFGGRQEMLYARATGGIYVSYNHGASWQQKLSGSFSAMTADPEHPWVIYAASEGHTLSGEWISVKVPPRLWSSKDGGESWSQIGPGPIADSGSGASINVLALEPGKDVIHAGTEAYGIYSVNLSPARRSPTPTFLVGSFGLAVLLLVVVVIVQAGRSVPRPWRPDWPKWPQLAYLRARYPKQFNLASEEDSRLSALECLALACASDGECEPAATWQRLTLEGIPVGYAQTKAALDSLVKHGLLFETDGEYHPENQLLSSIAQRHFWKYQPERERFAEQTRQEIHTDHLGSTIRFFERAGFMLVLRLKEGFVARSDRSEQMVYVHVHTLPSLEAARESIEDKIREIYRGELEGRAAFLVVNTPPHPEICRWAFELKEREQLDLYLIPYDRLCRAADAKACHEALQEILWLARGNQDLFWLDEPASSRIDFFGREELLERLVVACQSGELIGLEGMPGVGKTSLVHQVVDRLSESIVATVDLRGTSGADLYLAIRRLWQEQAEGNDPRLVFPSPENPLEEPDEQQIQDDLAALMEKLSPQIQLVAVVEGVEELPAKSAVSRLASAIGREERASLLVVFNTYPRHAVPHPVLPVVLLDEATSAQMVYSLSGRMALEFSPEAVKDLHQASGGHPLVLRQLASLSIVQKRRLDRQVTVADVREAVVEYVGQSDSALENLWESLTEEEQRVLWAALGKGPAAGSPGRLYDLGWLRSKNGQLACFSGALAQWLTAQPPPGP